MKMWALELKQTSVVINLKLKMNVNQVSVTHDCSIH